MKLPTEPECSEAALPAPSAMTNEQLVHVAKALAHPARLQILGQFSGCRPRTVHDIVADGTLAQSTVSEHLRILRDAEVLFVTRDGAWNWYCVRRLVLAEFASAVERLAQEPVPVPER